MHIEIKAPGSLPLGLARLDAQRSAWVSLALQYPQIELRAQARPAGLSLLGPRAQVAHPYAERFLSQPSQPPPAEIEIEWAIPSRMGLGSEPALAMAVGRALAWAAGQPALETAGLAAALGLPAETAAAAWGVDQGGLLLVAADPGAGWPPLLRRAAVTHASQDDDWVLVFLLPRPPETAPVDLEQRQLAALSSAAEHLSAATGELVQARLFPAVERDDLAGFAAAWQELDALNRAALAQAGTPAEVSPAAQAALDVIRGEGALVWGQSLTGLALYGLVRGVDASHALRKALRAHAGHEGGTVTATLMAPAGAALREQEGALTQPDPPIRMVGQPPAADAG